MVENNFLTATKNDALGKALDDQKEGKNLLKASQDIVRLTNEDKASNILLEQYRNGKLETATGWFTRPVWLHTHGSGQCYSGVG
ncbi:hypothetical protein KKI90_19325 [Xenorhabdus bovienii]|uniref:hypothetical protein n=1 Tax=Xenorhabdus bovienii TaxID=40576 RepID=UPI00237CD142|nr:hypothetical protein [Xenorhabdus bovienii]MDE1488442.1 hypothetical protein [Xenorhabdus bovienii]MDE9479309.1 hypothetical protein [Xenorhabdus bovienii]MDE9532101.1 hypothetical protein [Xenorhabdus bovienii]